MATVTLNYDGRSSLMKHLIEAMLAAGATYADSTDQSNEVTPALRAKIKKAQEESARGETIVCSTLDEMQQFFDSL